MALAAHQVVGAQPTRLRVHGLLEGACSQVRDGLRLGTRFGAGTSSTPASVFEIWRVWKARRRGRTRRGEESWGYINI